MLTDDDSLNDSLNDSLQPSQLRSIEAEFETNKLYRLTYSSEEKDNHHHHHNSFENIKQLIQQNDFVTAHQQLQLIQSDNMGPEYYFLSCQIYYALQKYTQLFENAQNIIYLNHYYANETLQLLVDACIRIKQFDTALEYQLQLINKNSTDNSYQIKLAEIYLLLNKPQQAYYSYLHAYKNGEFNLISKIAKMSYTHDFDNFLKYAQIYLEYENQDPIDLMPILFWMAKQTQQLEYQQRGVDLIIQHNGLKNENTFLALINLAQMKFDAHQFREALQDFELSSQIIAQLEGQINNKFITSLYKQAQCLYKSNELKQCLDCLQRLYELIRQKSGNMNETILVNMIHIQIKLGMDCLENIKILFVTQNAVLLNEVGIMLQQDNQIELAIEIYSEGLKYSGEEAGVLINLNLAVCFALQRNYQRSVDLFKQCGQRMDEEGQICVERRISQVYRDCGKLRESMFHLRRALVLAKRCGQEQRIVDIQNEINQF